MITPSCLSVNGPHLAWRGEPPGFSRVAAGSLDLRWGIRDPLWFPQERPVPMRMGEIGDFSAFSKPKQLFAYFGLDPAVKQSGKFEGTKIQMSKRGSSIARRVIHTLTLQSISVSRTGEAKNSVLRHYYLEKCKSKPKLVAMGAVSHKICNMIFAILRDNRPFEIITPQEHIKQYNAAKCDIAA